MRGSIAIALIVVGGCLLLGPLVINAYNSNRDKDRVAEFYSRTSNAAVLPKNLTLSAFTAYDWGMMRELHAPAVRCCQCTGHAPFLN
jgi:hypothetical protein